MEPEGWPPQLNVMQRMRTTYVLDELLPRCLVTQWAVRRVIPCQAGRLPLSGEVQRAKFLEIVEYLASRDRAGVVENLPASGGLPARMMYLFPPSAALAARLQVAWSPKDDGLWAITVPAGLTVPAAAPLATAASVGSVVATA